jgi:hypothetical protein
MIAATHEGEHVQLELLEDLVEGLRTAGLGTCETRAHLRRARAAQGRHIRVDESVDEGVNRSVSEATHRLGID